jgi:hypothetical protein
MSPRAELTRQRSQPIFRRDHSEVDARDRHKCRSTTDRRGPPSEVLARVDRVVSQDVFDEFRDEPRLFEQDDRSLEARGANALA